MFFSSLWTSLLSYSFIFRLKSLAPLLQLTHLRSLCLIDRQKNFSNPLCNASSYRQDVKNNLPNLGIIYLNPLHHKKRKKNIFFSCS